MKTLIRLNNKLEQLKGQNSFHTKMGNTGMAEITAARVEKLEQQIKQIQIAGVTMDELMQLVSKKIKQVVDKEMSKQPHEVRFAHLDNESWDGDEFLGFHVDSGVMALDNQLSCLKVKGVKIDCFSFTLSSGKERLTANIDAMFDALVELNQAKELGLTVPQFEFFNKCKQSTEGMLMGKKQEAIGRLLCIKDLCTWEFDKSVQGWRCVAITPEMVEEQEDELKVLMELIVSKANWFHNTCCNMPNMNVFRVVVEDAIGSTTNHVLKSLGFGEHTKLIKKMVRDEIMHVLLDDEMIHFTMPQHLWEEHLGEGFLHNQLDLI